MAFDTHAAVKTVDRRRRERAARRGGAFEFIDAFGARPFPAGGNAADAAAEPADERADDDPASRTAG